LDPVLFSALLAGIADRVASRQHAGAARLVRALGLAFALSIVLEFVQLGLE
ncbi:MAG: hypothetical protein GWN53_08390, partial [Gammaproteobacteria bacterium]|nr:hypothetical protein [Gammaproteobacteria bacterium]